MGMVLDGGGGDGGNLCGSVGASGQAVRRFQVDGAGAGREAAADLVRRGREAVEGAGSEHEDGAGSQSDRLTNARVNHLWDCNWLTAAGVAADGEEAGLLFSGGDDDPISGTGNNARLRQTGCDGLPQCLNSLNGNVVGLAAVHGRTRSLDHGVVDWEAWMVRGKI